VLVATFAPDRSQRRCLAANDGDVKLVIGEPDVTTEKLDLYDRFHAFQSDHVGWPSHGPKDAAATRSPFVETRSTRRSGVITWREVGRRGLRRSASGGLSAIYFFHDPEERHRSLGTYNVLSVLRAAGELKLPHVYLAIRGGLRSLEYKTASVRTRF